MEPERQPAALWDSKLQQSGPVLGVGDCQPTLEPCLCLPSAKIKGMHYYAHLPTFLLTWAVPSCPFGMVTSGHVVSICKTLVSMQFSTSL